MIKKIKSSSLLIACLFIVTNTANATELIYQFKSPSFSGIGTSAHYLTIDEQESTRKLKMTEDIQSALEEAARNADNTTLAKFVRNLESRIFSRLSQDLESRIFSRLSQDLAESLFDDKGGSGGSIDLEGNTINFLNTGTEIILTILDIDGTITEIRIPIGSFGICADAPCAP